MLVPCCRAGLEDRAGSKVMSYLRPTASSSSVSSPPSPNRRRPPSLRTSLSPGGAGTSPPASSRSSRLRRPSPSAIPVGHSGSGNGAFGFGNNGSSMAAAAANVDDRPVAEFIDAISALSADSWQARTLALETLVNHVPASDTEEGILSAALVVGNGISGYSPPDGMVPFYLSPTTLRRLASPIGNVLTDPRSSVVKHACHHLVLLVERTAAAPSISPSDSSRTAPRPDRARHLLRDLLPTILTLHAQTVNVIRGYTTTMMLTVLSLCRFKSGLPTLLDALRKNKSRDVREACARYLRAVLEAWSGTTAQNAVGERTAYLAQDVVTHIGNALAKALMDPSQCVRMEARTGFETFRTYYPEPWHAIVHRDGGPLSKDIRLKKSIINAAVRADAERAAVEGPPIAGVGHAFGGDDDGNSGVASSYSSGVRKKPMLPRATVGKSKSRIPAPSPRRRHVTAASAPPLPKTPPKARGRVGNSKAPTTNAFASLIASPAPTTVMRKKRDNTLGRNQNMQMSSSSSLQERLVNNRAATSIQAAFRGTVTRKSMLPPEAFDESGSGKSAGSPPTLPGVTNTMTDSTDLTPPSSPSPEIDMIHAAREKIAGGGRKSLMGNTARMMANRRKTIGAKDSGAVSPLNPSTPSDEVRKSFSSPPLQGEMQETPRAAINAEKLGWKDESPVQAIAFDNAADDPIKARPSKATCRDRKSSIMLQNRLRQSSVGGAGAKYSGNNGEANLSPCIEHVDIAQELLVVHRSHIDGLMATLRMDMDIINEFEAILQDDQGPSEDDVLSYFESIQASLEERFDMSRNVHSQLDKISRGDDDTDTGPI